MYVVSLTSRHIENQIEIHLLVPKRIFRYLESTANFGLFYKKNEKSNLYGFTDSDYTGVLDDRRSTSRYLFMMASAIVSWLSKKQPIVMLPTIKAKLVAAIACACQAIWLKKILEELHFKQEEAIVIYCDNNSAIKLSKNTHIDVEHHFLRDLTNNQEIDFFFYYKSEDQVADVSNKPLKLASFLKLRKLLGVCKMEDSTWRRVLHFIFKLNVYNISLKGGIVGNFIFMSIKYLCWLSL